MISKITNEKTLNDKQDKYANFNIFTLIKIRFSGILN